MKIIIKKKTVEKPELEDFRLQIYNNNPTDVVCTIFFSSLS